MTFTSYGMDSAENGSIFLHGIRQADDRQALACLLMGCTSTATWGPR